MQVPIASWFSKSVSGTWQIPLGTLRSVEQFKSLAQFFTHTHIDNDQFSTRLTYYFVASASVIQRLRDSDAATVFREFELCHARTTDRTEVHLRVDY